ncbi:MAG TPA: L-threonylcarbamoyladenylate synthase [Myxococcaceae bacterium]|nr:L-threonylcarbamoyladenylate synthase [Myxococcaceae bacterium]
MQNDEKLAEAVACLARGGLVAIPTETVYGLAADASNELAVRRIFAAKQRPATHPLIVHLAGVEQLPRWAREIPPVALQLAGAFWPGPLTLVLPRTTLATDAITGGQDTVALRVPDHPLTLALLKAFDGGLVAPSANRFGRVSPTTAAHVAEELGDAVELILDGGPCRVGLESTILDLTGATPEVLRPGGTSLTALAEVLGFEPRVRQGGSVRVSGTLESHYAPRAGVMLCAPEALEETLRKAQTTGQQVMVLSPSRPEGATLWRELPADPEQAAPVLYQRLREVDASGAGVAVISLPSPEGLGLAVRDRLRRAAAPR